MKIVMELISGERVELTEAEANSIAANANKSKLVTLSRLSRTLAVHQIKDIRTLRPVTCQKCGSKTYEGYPHYCQYHGLDNILNDETTTSPNLDKLREQMKLMRSGVPSRIAYHRVWGVELPKDVDLFRHQKNIRAGYAKLLYTIDGVPYVAYGSQYGQAKRAQEATFKQLEQEEENYI